MLELAKLLPEQHATTMPAKRYNSALREIQCDKLVSGFCNMFYAMIAGSFEALQVLTGVVSLENDELKVDSSESASPEAELAHALWQIRLGEESENSVAQAINLEHCQSAGVVVKFAEAELYLEFLQFSRLLLLKIEQQPFAGNSTMFYLLGRFYITLYQKSDPKEEVQLLNTAAQYFELSVAEDESNFRSQKHLAILKSCYPKNNTPSSALPHVLSVLKIAPDYYKKKFMIQAIRILSLVANGCRGIRRNIRKELLKSAISFYCIETVEVKRLYYLGIINAIHHNNTTYLNTEALKCMLSSRSEDTWKLLYRLLRNKMICVKPESIFNALCAMNGNVFDANAIQILAVHSELKAEVVNLIILSQDIGLHEVALRSGSALNAFCSINRGLIWRKKPKSIVRIENSLNELKQASAQSGIEMRTMQARRVSF